jgi:hypothetical protein
MKTFTYNFTSFKVAYRLEIRRINRFEGKVARIYDAVCVEEGPGLFEWHR